MRFKDIQYGRAVDERWLKQRRPQPEAARLDFSFTPTQRHAQIPEVASYVLEFSTEEGPSRWCIRQGALDRNAAVGSRTAVSAIAEIDEYLGYVLTDYPPACWSQRR